MKTKVVAVIAGTLTLMVMGGLAAADQNEKRANPASGINPELVDEPIDYERLLRELGERASNLEGEIEKVEISIPDYKPARKALKEAIIKSVAGYLTSLERIKKEIAPFYSRLAALQEQIKKNPASAPLFSKLLESELTRNAPAVNTKINEIYANALKTLDTLDNQFTVLPAESHYWFKRAKEDPSASEFGRRQLEKANPIIAGCRTAACVYMIGADLAAWLTLVKQLNRDIDFRNVQRETFVELEKDPSSILLADTMVDFAKDLLEGPKTNQRYTVAGYVAEVLKQPAGAAVGLAAAPLFAFEKTFQFTQNVLDSTIITVELKLNQVKKLPNASKKASILTKMLDSHAAGLPTVDVEPASSSALIQ